MTGRIRPRTPTQTKTHPTTDPHRDPGLFTFVIQPGTFILAPSYRIDSTRLQTLTFKFPSALVARLSEVMSVRV
jgi:hypothetical protein